MKALLYMSKRKWINKLKQLKKKPVNLILSIVLVAYFIFLITVSVTALVKADFQTPYWLLAALTVWGLYNFFINFATSWSTKVFSFGFMDFINFITLQTLNT